ncbi:MAG: alginate lyase family protein, partial [Anaerolineales bacterium]
LDLSRPGLEQVRAAVERADWTAAYQAWGVYFAGRQRPVPLVNLDTYAALPEALRQSRGPAVIAAARLLAAQPVDLVTPRPGRSALYGLHYFLWMQPLITAYSIDRDDDHIQTFVNLINTWYEARDRVVSEIPSIDVIWYTLGLAIRSQMFTSAYSAFRHSPLLDPQLHQRLLKSFLGAARWMFEEHDRFRYGNWQLTAVSSLYELGVFWPEFREAQAWRQSGWTRLLEHLELDLYPDGGHSERSPSYQRHILLLCYARVASVAELNGQPLLQDQPRFHALYRWMLDLCTPLGSATNFNDAHNEWVGKWAVQGAVLCADPALKWLAEQFGSPDDIAWSLAALPDRPDGRTAAQFYARLPSRAPDLTSRLLDTSKFAIMRTGLGPDDLYLAINYGPLVGHEFESHSHLDALSFVCFGYGAALAVEAGLPGNYDDLLYTTWIRQAVAHNMVIVDGADPDENAKEGDLLFWSASPVMDVFGAEHAGYQARGVRHRRTILFVKGEYWIVHDALRLAGSHRLDWRVYTAQPFSLERGRLEPSVAPGLVVIPVLPAAGARLE